MVAGGVTGIASMGGGVPSGDCAAGLVDALCATIAGAITLPGAFAVHAGVVAGDVAAIALAGAEIPAGDAVRGILMDALCFADIALPGVDFPPTLHMLA